MKRKPNYLANSWVLSLLSHRKISSYYQYKTDFETLTNHIFSSFYFCFNTCRTEFICQSPKI